MSACVREAISWLAACEAAHVERTRRVQLLRLLSKQESWMRRLTDLRQPISPI